MKNWVLHIPEVATANGWCMKTSCFQCLTYPYFDDYLKTTILEHSKLGEGLIKRKDLSLLNDKEKLLVCFTVCNELRNFSGYEIDIIEPYPLRNIFMFMSQLFKGNNEPIKILLGECEAKNYLMKMENHYENLKLRQIKSNHINNKYTNSAYKILRNPKIPNAWLQTPGVIRQSMANQRLSKSGQTYFSKGKQFCSNCEEYRPLCEFKNSDAINGYQMKCLQCHPIKNRT